MRFYPFICGEIQLIFTFEMPKKDIYHEIVKFALEKDEWLITDDPLYLEWEGATYYPDLGAERIIAATKGTEKIAVEIKTFTGQVLQEDFYKALGQFDNYYYALQEIEPDRTLVLAIPTQAYESFFQKRYVTKIIAKKAIILLIYNIETYNIDAWIRP